MLMTINIKIQRLQVSNKLIMHKKMDINIWMPSLTKITRISTIKPQIILHNCHYIAKKI